MNTRNDTKTGAYHVSRRGLSRFHRIAAIALLLSLWGCQARLEKRLAMPQSGEWVRADDTASDVTAQYRISFMPGGEYRIIAGNTGMVFGGSFERVGKDTLRLTDTFCGTKLPGEYRVTFDGSTLTFSLLNDKYCARGNIFPGAWVRVQTPDSSRSRS